MVLGELALILLCVALSHIASLPLLLLKLPPIPAYIAVGILLRSTPFNISGIIWENLVGFSLVFVGLHAGLSSKIKRDSIKRIALVSLVNVGVSAAAVYIFLALLTGDFIKSLLMSVLLANTATEGVLSLSRYTKHKSDAEIALEISIGDDIAVLLLSTVVLALIGTQQTYEILLATLVIAGVTIFLSVFLKKNVDRAILNTISIATLFILIALTVDNIGPLVGGYVVGIVLSSTASSGDPLLKVARNVEALVDGLEHVNSLVFLPLVFTYIGLGVSISGASTQLVWLGLLGAVLGKHAATSVLKKINLVTPLSTREVAALITVRGSLESAIALTALKSKLFTAEEFAALIIISLLTYPISTALVALSRRSISKVLQVLT
ncbi:MAG: cation:proton antiporter [Sulfolobales archaeon]